MFWSLFPLALDWRLFQKSTSLVQLFVRKVVFSHYLGFNNSYGRNASSQVTSAPGSIIFTD